MLSTLTKKRTAKTPTCDLGPLPSTEKLDAARQRFNELTREREDLEARLTAARQAAKPDRERLALARLDGLPAETAGPSVQEIAREIDLLERALRIQQGRVDEAKEEWQRDARIALTPKRNELLSRVDDAVAQLCDALVALGNFTDEAILANATTYDGIGAPWKSAALAVGNYNGAGLVEKLREWRAEFEATGFTIR